MRCFAIFVNCLLLSTCVVKTEKTSEAEESENQCLDLLHDDDLPDYSCLESLSTTKRQHVGNRLEDLLPSFDMMTFLAKLPIGNKSLLYLDYIYESCVTVRASPQPVGNFEAKSTGEFLQHTASVLANVYLKYDSKDVADFNSKTFVFVDKIKHSKLKRKNKMDFSLTGVPVFTNKNITVSEMCVITDETQLALVVLPSDSSPFRPPPVSGIHVDAFQIVHVILTRPDGFTAPGACPDDKLFRMVAFRARSRSDLQYVRVRCAQWSDAIRDWSSEFCLAVKSFDLAEIQCHCDTTFNGETTEYIVYEYIENVKDFSALWYWTPEVKNVSDVVEMKKAAEMLSKARESAASLETFIGVLFEVMQFDTSVLGNNCSSEKILDDIRGIMEDVNTIGGLGAIGRSNQLLKSFVFDLDYYRYDPLLAYAFFNSTEHRLDMEFFRSKEEVDYNRLFSWSMEYSLLFSKSVVLQNSRYGFILYPLDKFFIPVVEIDGVRVVASRVLDVFLVPWQDSKDSQDQLVHMFFNPGVQDSSDAGCAYRSASLDSWTTKGCYPNNELHPGVCTCAMSAHFGESRKRATFVSVKFKEDSGKERASSPRDTNFVTLTSFALRNLDRLYRDEATGVTALQLLNTVYDKYLSSGGRLNAATTIDIVHAVGNALVSGDANPAVPENTPKNDKECATFQAVIGPTLNDADFFCQGDVNKMKLRDHAASLNLRMSNTLKRSNTRYAILVHPVNFNVRQLPAIGKTIVRSYAFDVVMVPGGDGVDGVEQFLEITIDQNEFNASLGCSYWKDDIASWTTDRCKVIEVYSRQICKCRVTSKDNESRTYGEYIAYDYVTAHFDKKLYGEFLAKPRDSDADVDFDLGMDMLHTLTQVPFETDSFTKLFHIYLRVLSLGNPLLMRRQHEVGHVLDDLALLINKYPVKIGQPVTEKFTLHGTQRLILKSGDVTVDLFSNPELSATKASNTTKTAGLSTIVLGFYPAPERESQGFYLLNCETSDQINLMSNTLDNLAVSPSSSLACLVKPANILAKHRVVFIVYPINVSPYPLTMTPHAVFNTRQLDVHVGFDRSASKKIQGTLTLVVYFRMSPKSKYYIDTACASWDAVTASWSDDLCKPSSERTKSAGDVLVCTCNLKSRNVTSIIMYEFTELDNFTFIVRFDGSAIVFFVAAIATLFGIFMVGFTAYRFPEWRDVFDNKILMGVSVSTFLHIVLALYREMHHVYTASNYSSVRLLVFAVCVHYARLSRYAWGLVMSVLQYKRFSRAGMAPSKITHLFPKICVLAWGAPLIPLIVLLAKDPMAHFCVPDLLTHYVLHLGPIVSVTLFNVVLLAVLDLTVANGCGDWEDVAVRDWKLGQLRVAVFTCLLFGVPAAGEVAHAVGGRSVALEYINKTLDPLQGFFFVFFVLSHWRAWCYHNNPAMAEVLMESVTCEEEEDEDDEDDEENDVEVPE